jgi:hypothetical protein
MMLQRQNDFHEKDHNNPIVPLTLKSQGKLQFNL